MGERKIVRAIDSFTTNVSGRPVSVNIGDLFYSDDLVVKGRESLFGDPLVRTSEGPRVSSSVTGSVVETMTAEPGARRRLGRPVKQQTRIADADTASVRVEEARINTPVETATSEV